MVVINKVDRQTARVEEVENEIFDLFCNLEADDDQLEYPIVYSAATQGWAVKDLKGDRKGVSDLLDSIVEHIAPPPAETTGDLKMLINQTESNQYFGKMLIGRILSGSVSIGDKVQAVGQDGEVEEQGKI